MFQIFIGILAFSTFLSFINHKLLKLPDTIGVMILSIITSLGIASISFIDKTTYLSICAIVSEIDFRHLLFDFLLSFLLFAGAIHVNLFHLLKERAPVITYASFGVLASTFIIGTAIYYLAPVLGLQITYMYCLVFGALISPTDPVAVLALLKKAHVSKDMEIKIVGESLFNDGVGIVVFVFMLSFASMEESTFHFSHLAEVFGVEALGGIAMGLVLGYVGKYFIKTLEDAPVIAVQISLAIVMGGYSLSSLLNVSGALAMVVAGLIIGQFISTALKETELKLNMDIFWKVLDNIFNTVLFVLIGIEVLSIAFVTSHLLLGLAGILIVLAARYASIRLSNALLKKEHRSKRKGAIILTWAGLRGGISIALALGLPPGETRELIVFITYVIVVFSIIVQGLTIGKLIRKLE